MQQLGKLEGELGPQFSLSSDYQLIASEELPLDLKQIYADVIDAENFFGMLIPRPGSGRNPKLVSSGDAFLFSWLQFRGSVPDYFYKADKSFDQYLQKLVLDGILVSDKPVFACNELRLNEDVSDVAIIQAYLSGETDALRLTAKLYFYGRLPCSLQMMKSLPDTASLLNFLKSKTSGSVAKPKLKDCWMHWNFEESNLGKLKLYFCCQPLFVNEVFEPVYLACQQSDAVGLKLAADAVTLHRPDKFVAYFETMEALECCLERLAEVPTPPKQELAFVAPTQLDWVYRGIDPDKETKPLPFTGGQSWRVWICQQLSLALIEARRNSLTPWEAVARAKSRLELDGVNCRTWELERQIGA